MLAQELGPCLNGRKVVVGLVLLSLHVNPAHGPHLTVMAEVQKGDAAVSRAYLTALQPHVLLGVIDRSIPDNNHDNNPARLNPSHSPIKVVEIASIVIVDGVLQPEASAAGQVAVDAVAPSLVSHRGKRTNAPRTPVERFNSHC